MYTYPDQIGYINNKKGFVSSTYGDETISYILSTKTTPTGKQLTIKTYKEISNVMVKCQTITPILPYRIIVKDVEFFDSIKKNLYNDYLATNLYNPGITAYNDHITMPGIFYGSCKFIELNVTHNSLKYFASNMSYLYQEISGYKTYIVPNTIKAYDIESSIVCSTDGTYDYLYIANCSKIVINGKQLDQSESRWKDIEHNYSIPVVVMLKILRSSIISSASDIETLPISWSYSINPRWLIESDNLKTTSVSKINSSVSGGPTTNLWNYNIIPGKYHSFNNGPDYFYQPLNFGCYVDIDYISSNSIVCFSSIGNYSPIWNLLRPENTIIRIAFTTGFVQETSLYNAFIRNDERIYNNCIYKSGDYYVTVFNHYTEEKDEICLAIFDINLRLKSQIFFGPNCFFGDLIMKNSDLYFMYYVDTKRYIFKFPTIDNVVTTNLGYSFTTSSSIQQKLVYAGATFSLDGVGITKTKNLINYNINFSENNNKIYKIDTNSMDKSMNTDLYNGYYHSLTVVDYSLIGINKISFSSIGQNNQIDTFKL